MAERTSLPVACLLTLAAVVAKAFGVADLALVRRGVIRFVMRSLIMSASTRVRLLRGSGVLLIVLAIVHLVATPHIATLIRHSASMEAADWLTPRSRQQLKKFARFNQYLFLLLGVFMSFNF